jgi:hypothetical protein
MAAKWKARWLTAGLVLGIGALACADPTATTAPDGTAALSEFLRRVPLDAGARIVGMTGFDAGPRPSSWLILVEDVSAEGGYREWAFDGTTVLAQRSLSPLPGQEFPALPIEPDRLRVSSDEACRIAMEQARSRGGAVRSAHIQLRIREEGNEPVWMLKLLGPGRSEAGTIYVSAQSGTILRQSWTKGRGSERDKVSAR